MIIGDKYSSPMEPLGKKKEKVIPCFLSSFRDAINHLNQANISLNLQLFTTIWMEKNGSFSVAKRFLRSPIKKTPKMHKSKTLKVTNFDSLTLADSYHPTNPLGLRCQSRWSRGREIDRLKGHPMRYVVGGGGVMFRKLPKQKKDVVINKPWVSEIYFTTIYNMNIWLYYVNFCIYIYISVYIYDIEREERDTEILFIYIYIYHFSG